MKSKIIRYIIYSFFVMILFLTSSLWSDSFTTSPQIACGYSHTVALKRDGTVWTWGSGGSGQLGRPVDKTSLTRPAPIKNFNLMEVIMEKPEEIRTNSELDRKDIP